MFYRLIYYFKRQFSFQFVFSPGWPSFFSCLDGKESPGGVAVGCYTRRVTDRAWTGIQSGGETPEGNAAMMVREREFDSPRSDKCETKCSSSKIAVNYLLQIAGKNKKAKISSCNLQQDNYSDNFSPAICSIKNNRIDGLLQNVLKRSFLFSGNVIAGLSFLVWFQVWLTDIREKGWRGNV